MPPDEQKPPLRFKKLRITWSAVCCIAIFSITHYTIGIIALLECDNMHAWIRSTSFSTALVIFVKLWWFPSLQILEALRYTGMLGFPITVVNSLVWGALVVTFWQQGFRFTLRTLLIATTLVAVVLGLAVFAASK